MCGTLGAYWNIHAFSLNKYTCKRQYDLNKQEPDRVQKKIARIFKKIEFKSEIVTNLTEADFLDATFKLKKNPNDMYIPPNYEQNNPRRKKQCKTIRFNPPFKLIVSTIVAKIFFKFDRKKIILLKQITQKFKQKHR